MPSRQDFVVGRGPGPHSNEWSEESPRIWSNMHYHLRWVKGQKAIMSRIWNYLTAALVTYDIGQWNEKCKFKPNKWIAELRPNSSFVCLVQQLCKWQKRVSVRSEVHPAHTTRQLSNQSTTDRKRYTSWSILSSSSHICKDQLGCTSSTCKLSPDQIPDVILC